MGLTRRYVPYWEWEEWLDGMWRKLSKNEEEGMLQWAISFTGDHTKYGEAMRAVVKAWPRTMENSLTNPSINRRAFLGHCACQFHGKCPEYITRMAWKQLSDTQRQLADLEAQNVIDNYEAQAIGIHQRLGGQVLF